MKKISGIYVIICVENGNYYLGSSNDILERKVRHLNDLLNSKHHCDRLQRCYSKYGKDSLLFFMVEMNIPENLLKTREQIYLSELKINKNECLNSSFISNRVEMTDEIKHKLSIKSKNRYKNKENHPRFGMHLTEATKQKQKNSWKIKYQNGYVNPNTGKSMTDELKQKLLSYNLNKNVNSETKQKMSDAHKGQKSYCFDYNIYTFKNTITNEIFTGYKYDFRIKFGLKKQSIGQLAADKLKSHKNWILIKK
jgi:group I intron endonuclease